MLKNKVMIYGAGGYVGGLVIKELETSEINFVLASNRLINSTHETRIFSLNNYERILSELKDVMILLNLAGPFAVTNQILIKACIESGVHYLDIAGEADEFQTAYNYNLDAIKQGVTLIPGAGFGVVPTDLAAKLAKDALPNANNLTISYLTFGGASKGTLKTVLQNIEKSGIVVKNGKAVPEKPGIEEFYVNYKGKKIKTVYNPWRADLFTAQISTQIPNIKTFSNFPTPIVSMMQGKHLWLRDLVLNKLIKFIPNGPSQKSLLKGKTFIQAEACSKDGNISLVRIEGPDAYIFTVKSIISIINKIINKQYTPGFQTPSIYGVELIKNIAGVMISIENIKK